MGNPKKSLKQYTQANRAAWNEAMPRHREANGSKWDDAFSRPGFVAMTGVELEMLGSTGVSNKKIAHVCCNNGVELMSLKNMGAARCVGFDICDAAIEEASATMLEKKFSCLPILKRPGVVVGIVTKTDLLGSLFGKRTPARI